MSHCVRLVSSPSHVGIVRASSGFENQMIPRGPHHGSPGTWVSNLVFRFSRSSWSKSILCLSWSDAMAISMGLCLECFPQHWQQVRNECHSPRGNWAKLSLTCQCWPEHLKHHLYQILRKKTTKTLINCCKVDKIV